MWNRSKKSAAYRVLTFGVLLGIYIAALSQSSTAHLLRGPYLQQGAPTSIVVRWRTDLATNSRVRYGLSAGSLTSQVDIASLTTEHEVTLSGLSPDTTYYYSAGSTTETLASGPDHFFVTSPGSGKPTRVWVLGDSGTANANVLAVRDAYTTFTAARHTDLWLMLGDNAYSSGTDAEYQQAVFAMFPEMLRKSVLWPTRGNHEQATDATGPVYYSIFTLPKNAEAGGLASGSEAYYSFDYGDIHFICLDSYGSNRSVGGPMLTWLQNDLAATNKTWIVAFWHHPPYSKGSHNSDTEIELVQMRENALPILEQGGVDLVLGGHSHSYERSFLLDGHYGTSTTLTSAMKLDAGSGRPGDTGSYKKLGPAPDSPHLGAVYTVAGSSGQASGGTLNHPAMYISMNNMGSLVLDVDGNTMNVKYLRDTGVIDDYFTIQKAVSTSVPPSITGPASPLPNGMVDTAFAATMTATGDQPIVWSLAGGSLPPGMTLHSTGIYSGKPTAAGTFSFTVRASNVSPDDTRSFTHTIDPLTQTPLSGTPSAIPGRIQAEDFDNGGEGVAFHDTTSANSLGKYRNTGVDIETNTDGGAGFNIGSTVAGEWLEYTTDVSTAGTYSVSMRLASAATGARIHVEVDGIDRTGPVVVPNTGGWQTWQTVTASGISLTAGQHLLRVVMETNGATGSVANFNYMDWVSSTVTPPTAPSALAATAVSNSQIDLSWTDTSADETGFKIERSTDSANYTQIATVGANTTAYSDIGLTSSTTYSYRLRAYNSGGDSPYSNSASATTLSGPPAAPTGLTLKSVSSSQIDLSWSDNSTDESGFRIERSLDGTSFTEIAVVGPNVKTYSSIGLAKNTRYYYRVRAYNGAGNSTYSNTANTKTRPK